jgi:hypothetical protein
VRALAIVFRAKYLEGLQRACDAGQLTVVGGTADLAAFTAMLGRLRTVKWVVYAKRPLAGPEQVLEYLGRYTHRVALSNNRLVSLEDHVVRFAWRDYADHDRRKVMALAVDEFLRRFLLHVLPRGFMRIRHFGLLANRRRAAMVARCRQVLAAPTPPTAPDAVDLIEAILRRCSVCHIGHWVVVRDPALTRPASARPTGLVMTRPGPPRPWPARRVTRHVGVVVPGLSPTAVFGDPPSALATPGRSAARFVPYADRRRTQKFVRLSGGPPIQSP